MAGYMKDNTMQTQEVMQKLFPQSMPAGMPMGGASMNDPDIMALLQMLQGQAQSTPMPQAAPQLPPELMQMMGGGY